MTTGNVPVDVKLKDPNAVLDYTFDYSTNYLVSGDTILTSTWTLPSGITKDSDTFTTTTTTIWLSGGTAGTDYLLINRITTSGGRTDERTFKIKCVQR
jgi:hypothetical protein